MCNALIAPGRNGNCEACYWKWRCEIARTQLTELYRHEPVGLAFSAYVQWAIEHNDAKRLCLSLRRHVEFFGILDQYPGAVWDSTFLLKVFGTRKLRMFELPMRWLQQQRAIQVAPEDKRANAEAHTSRKLLESIPANSVARRMLQAFFDELHGRLDAGTIKPLSIRVALRPAASLLLAASAEGALPPDQNALDNMLRCAPGQRAAVSTFLGFLKAHYGIALVAPKTALRRIVSAREKLSLQLAQIANEKRRDSKTLEQWTLTALRYFHRLSKAQAIEIAKTATRIVGAGGEELHLEQHVFWLPYPPEFR
ncbi:MAG: hypothetical protein QM740_06250 [Acidovorax sp.]